MCALVFSTAIGVGVSIADFPLRTGWAPISAPFMPIQTKRTEMIGIGVTVTLGYGCAADATGIGIAAQARDGSKQRRLFAAGVKCHRVCRE